MIKDTDNVYNNPKENPEYKQRFEYENLDNKSGLESGFIDQRTKEGIMGKLH